MTDTCHVIRMEGAGERIEGEIPLSRITDGPFPCRLVIDPGGTHDLRTGRQRIEARIYLPTDAGVTVADRLIVNDETEWGIITINRLVRRGSSVAVEARASRIVD